MGGRDGGEGGVRREGVVHVEDVSKERPWGGARRERRGETTSFEEEENEREEKEEEDGGVRIIVGVVLREGNGGSEVIHGDEIRVFSFWLNEFDDCMCM